MEGENLEQERKLRLFLGVGGRRRWEETNVLWSLWSYMAMALLGIYRPRGEAQG